MSEAVVPLPLVPVTPTIGAGQRSKNILVAEVNGIPFFAAVTSSGTCGEMPGERIIPSKPVNGPSCPKWKTAPSSRMRATTSVGNSLSGLESDISKRAPIRKRKSAALWPSAPKPAKASRLSLKLVRVYMRELGGSGGRGGGPGHVQAVEFLLQFLGPAGLGAVVELVQAKNAEHYDQESDHELQISGYVHLPLRIHIPRISRRRQGLKPPRRYSIVHNKRPPDAPGRRRSGTRWRRGNHYARGSQPRNRIFESTVAKDFSEPLSH